MVRPAHENRWTHADAKADHVAVWKTGSAKLYKSKG